MSLRSTLVIAVLATLLLPGFARAAESAVSISFADVLAAASGDLTIPAAWAGVWDIRDTTRNCGGPVTETDAGLDTLCTGASVFESPDGAPVSFDCTGTITDTVVDVDCTASFEVSPDCLATFTVALDATRTGDSYTAIQTMSITYSGGGLGCDLIPDTCTTTATTGTRIGPEPAECATPVEATTWGRVKARYR